MTIQDAAAVSSSHVRAPASCVFTGTVGRRRRRKKKKKIKALGFIACVTVGSELELSWPIITISNLKKIKKKPSAAVTHRFCLNTVAKPKLMIRHPSQQKLLAVARDGRSA